ncbi:hypothetical protein CRENBAI_017898 [Crenichthys baileyi]|uniref:Uncharacterized protein n=1 Tax=Crenichthys baileyi TaxID=28760 RepID=A0AAV9R9Y0_9TELE
MKNRFKMSPFLKLNTDSWLSSFPPSSRLFLPRGFSSVFDKLLKSRRPLKTSTDDEELRPCRLFHTEIINEGPAAASELTTSDLQMIEESSDFTNWTCFCHLLLVLFRFFF